MKSSIIIPILNEKEIIHKSLENIFRAISASNESLHKCEVILSDAGSTDGSKEVIREFVKQKNWIFVENNFSTPSVGKTIKEGVKRATGEYVLIIPCDCFLTEQCFQQFFMACKKKDIDFGGFKKAFSPSTRLLDYYVSLQNSVRMVFFKNLVWTNSMFIRKKLLQEISFSTPGFLEDVILSDELKKKFKITFLDGPIYVSSRRYKNSSIKRIAVNLFILALFRLGYKRISALKSIYHSVS